MVLVSDTLPTVVIYFSLHMFSGCTVIKPHLKELPDGSSEAEEQAGDCFSKQMLSEQVGCATTVYGTLVAKIAGVF